VNRAGKSIVLIGMMGAGKSSVGRLLQRRTGLARFDTDEMVAAKFGSPVAEIFATQGETMFRDAESEALRSLTEEDSAIVVTGGGIVLRPENVDLAKQMGTVVWLEAKEETLFERASRRGTRPLLQTENPRMAFSTMLKARRPLYQSAADLRIDTTKLTHDEVADMILAEVEKRNA
jgi:shikimate kinase